MNIYFAGSIRGGRDDRELYAHIIRLLTPHGTVLTEHVGSGELSAAGESAVTDEYIYQRDMAWLRASDVVVAEVTSPSLGVGYEIGKAEEMGKRILCLYRPSSERRLSAMLRGHSEWCIEDYSSIEELPKIIENFFTNQS